MEVELVRSKNDMMSLNNQLLEAIQRKLELSQELEAWQVRSLYLCKAFLSIPSSLLYLVNHVVSHAVISSHFIFKSVSFFMKSSIISFICTIPDKKKTLFEAHCL